MGFNMMNGVFYATTYHPIQAGSIDGTDIAPHDNGVYRALLASSTGLYDPLGDPKAEGDPYCSLFVGRLSSQTDEKTLLEAMSRFGRVKGLRLVRHIVTGASRGYAFVEYETEKEMHQAYEGGYHMNVDNALIIVDYNRQQLMPGWIPRRLGGGLGGVKESGQLRFGGRDRPFRAPLKPIPHEELQKLGIPPPPEGRYMSRFQVPLPPMRKHDTLRGRYSGCGSKDPKHQGVYPKEENYTSAQDYNTLLKSHHGGESRKAGSREDDVFYRGDEDHEKRVEGGRKVKRRDDYSEHDRDMVVSLSMYEGSGFQRERSESKTRREDIMQDRDAGRRGSRDREKRREVRDDKYHNEKRQRRGVREHSSEKGNKGRQTEDYYEKANWKVEEYKERELKQKNVDPDERRNRDRELDHSNGRGENKRGTEEDYKERDIKQKNVDAEQRRGKDKELEHSKGRGDKERDTDEYERNHRKREEHKERDKKQNKVDYEQGNHESKRERRKDSREHAKEGGQKSHRHHELKHRKQEDGDQESLHGVEEKTHRSHKKHHKHRERSRGISAEEEYERKKQKQQEVDH